MFARGGQHQLAERAERVSVRVVSEAGAAARRVVRDRLHRVWGQDGTQLHGLKLHGLKLHGLKLHCLKLHGLKPRVR